MFQGFEWSVAARYLRARRADGFISVIAGFSFLGIMLGVATLIVVMSVMNGFREELVDRLLGLDGHYIVSGYGGQVQDWRPAVDALNAVEGVERVIPFVQAQVMASNRGNAQGVVIRAFDPQTLRQAAEDRIQVRSGDLNELTGNDTISLATRLASRLGVREGDQITLISPQGRSTPFGTAPRLQRFKVVALFEVGVSTYDDVLAIMPLSTAQTYFQLDDAVSNLEIFIDDPLRVDQRLPAINEAIGGVGVASSWKQRNLSLVTALDVERAVMFIILTLIIVVAAFNIISSLIILVKDKARDVAVLRTMGASRGSILRVFMLAGASIGVVGTIAGFLLGTVFVAYIDEIRLFFEGLIGLTLWDPTVRFLSEMPAKMDMGEVISVVVISLVLSLLATLPPSLRAARLDPVEVLRYE